MPARFCFARLRVLRCHEPSGRRCRLSQVATLALTAWLTGSAVAAQASPPLVEVAHEPPLIDLFGAEIVGRGDVNGDRVPDVLIGAPTVIGSGVVYLFHGPLPRDFDASEAVTTFAPTLVRTRVGGAMALADLDGDGGDDVLLGDPAAWGVGGNRGQVWIFADPAPGALDETDATVVIRGAGRAYDVGAAVAAGDLDGDGNVDVIVGAPDDNPELNHGAVFVFYGPFAGPLTTDDADWEIHGIDLNGEFGAEIAVGDIDGDGVEDFVVGQPFSQGGVGRAWIFLQALRGRFTTDVADARIDGNGGQFAWSLAAGQDLTSDSVPDLLVGEPRLDQTANGAVHVFAGPITGLPTGPRVLSRADAVGAYRAEAPVGQFGFAVDFAGDVNGDGTNDLIVGAPLAGGIPTAPRGRAYVFYGPAGGAVGAANADLVFQGQRLEPVGLSVAGLGDLDRNGLDDFAFGTPEGYRGSYVPPLRPTVTVISPRRGNVRASGCGANPGSLTVASGTPTPRTSLVFALDGGQVLGAAPVLLFSVRPPAGWPGCGPTLPGIGELLVSVAPPEPAVLAGAPWTGAPVPIELPIPASFALVGQDLFAQGVFVDLTGAAPMPLQLTNGMVATLGL
ncbi:MAG: hypothetical protein AAF628_12590 [Planctomycetota bacterium]